MAFKTETAPFKVSPILYVAKYNGILSFSSLDFHTSQIKTSKFARFIEILLLILKIFSVILLIYKISALNHKGLTI
jgi:hypothetical protein